MSGPNIATPMLKQYFQLKKEAGEAILLFRLGDFYEMFFEDAQIGAKVLGITLTSREAGKGRRIPMCGIVYHALDNYIRRFLKAGYKVAISEQVEDPAKVKGLVARQIVRLITPGTLVGTRLLDKVENNYIVSINIDKQCHKIGLAVADVSTGEFRLTELETIDEVISECRRIEVAEGLLPDYLKEDGSFIDDFREKFKRPLTFYDTWTFNPEIAEQRLIGHFRTHSLDGFGCKGLFSGLGAAGALLRYLEQTQKRPLRHFCRISTYFPSEYMIIDPDARRNLEIDTNLHSHTKKDSLFGILDYTLTPMGSRLLRYWLNHPLLDIEKIVSRQEAIGYLLERRDVRFNLRSKLKDIGDLERIQGRISTNLANARDLIALKDSLSKIEEIRQDTADLDIKSRRLSELCAAMDSLPELSRLIAEVIVDDPPAVIKEGGLIKRGYNKDLDELYAIVSGGKDWLKDLEKKEIEATGISSLKVRYNKVFGYYIEVTRPNLKLVPAHYIRKQTIATGERFITPELKEYEVHIMHAEERIVEIEIEIFNEIIDKVVSFSARVQKTAQVIAQLDVFVALSEVADMHGYICPGVDEGEVIAISNSRHPVLERTLGKESFVPNDILLDRSENQICIITGPNMAGKSTYIRQCALLVVMAQIGSFIPATSARIGIVDRIFTRLGITDDLVQGLSTFMIEMNETANILNNLQQRSLIILDEIGRGTSTFDGLSIAWAVVEFLHNHPAHPRTLFATHFHELTELATDLSGIKNYNVSVREWNDRVIFLYKIVSGSADKSFGIYVAQMAGIPRVVIKRAGEILTKLEMHKKERRKFTQEGLKPKELQIDWW